jgi:hypothetical protein
MLYHLGRCCTNAIMWYCCALGHSSNIVIPDHCCTFGHSCTDVIQSQYCTCGLRYFCSDRTLGITVTQQLGPL